MGTDILAYFVLNVFSNGRIVAHFVLVCLWEGADLIISCGHTKEQQARESVLFASNTASDIKLFSFHVR